MGNKQHKAWTTPSSPTTYFLSTYYYDWAFCALVSRMDTNGSVSWVTNKEGTLV
jgi:hypothetical protein